MSGGRVGIWGFGREGAAAWRYLRGGGVEAGIVVVDDDPARVRETAPGVEVVAFDELLTCATVWVSPGIRPVDPRRERLLAAGVRLVTGTDRFVAGAAARTVGITGTKGKSTTTTFAADLLAAEGETAERGGNLGVPLLDLLNPAIGAPRNDRAFFAVELSSYQCAALEHSPRVAVVTQLFDDHLLEHGTRDAYWGAKARVFGLGAEVLVAAPVTVERLRGVAAHALGAVEVVAPAALPDAATAHLAPHVADNLAHAVSGASALLGRPLCSDVVTEVARAYAPLPHRQTTVSDALGLTWVDDTLATTQESVQAALAAFPGRRVAVLLGGRDRGQPIDQLGPALRERHTRVLLVGETAGRFGRELSRCDVPAVDVGTVEAGVAWVAARHRDLDVCLLSPGAASYDQFRDHAAKGAAFAAAIDALPASLP